VTKFNPDIKQSTTRKGKVISLPDFYNLIVLEIEEGEDVKTYCKAISKFDGVEYAEPNFIIRLADTPPNDTNYAQQTGFEQANGHDIDANRAWDFTTGNYNIKVAVIDNGIDYHNPDLGNGDFGFEGAKVRGGWDYINNDADPDYTEADIDSHGTECAGIIGAIRNNNQGVAGLAGGNGNNIGVQLFALKVGPVTCQDGTLQCLNTARIIDAIIEASVWSPSFGYGCHVINNSYGGTDYSEAMRSAVRTAAQNNVVFVAAKGNNNTGNLNYPSDYDNSWVVSVGATDELDNRSIWCCGHASNFGNGIDVSAPGSRENVFNVFTTTVPGNNTYRGFDGTSAAAPHVSGLAALILTEANEQGIQLHHEDVEWIINSSAEDVNALNLPGYDDQMGHGRINAGRALEMMNAPWELTHQSVVGGTVVNTSGWYNMVFSDPGGGLASGIYSVRQHEVQRTVTTPFYTGDHFVWGRGANETTGWSGASPNYQIGFCDVVATTNTTATLRTFIYEVRTILGQNLGWRPTTAANLNFAYTTLGTPCPVTRNITENIVPGTRTTEVLYAASNTLTANNTVQTGSNIVYSAGNSVVLNAGFVAGADFRAITSGCINGNIGGRVATESVAVDQPKIELQKEESFEKESVVAYPNPFNDLITIEYVLTKQGNVSIELFDLTGKSIAVLVDNDLKQTGLHHVNFGGDFIKPGMYLYKMQTNLGVITGKIMKK
jgi:subtilisin family serine protease